MAQIVFYTYPGHVRKEGVYRLDGLLKLFEKHLLITHLSLLNPVAWLELFTAKALVMTASAGFPEKFLQRVFKLLRKPIVQIQHGEGTRFLKTTLKGYDKIHWCVYGDGIRNEMISQGFPPEQIHVTGMLHWDSLHKLIGEKRTPEIDKLFLMQPMFEYGLWDDKRLIDFLVWLPDDMTLQLHPMCKPENYPLCKIKTDSLHENILKSREVYGMYSTAMYEAVILGKDVKHVDPFNEHSFSENHFTPENVKRTFREVDGKAHKRVAEMMRRLI